MKGMLLIALGLVFVNGNAFAQGKTPLTTVEMKALLAKGLSVSSTDLQGGKEYTANINLAADGKLSGTLTVTGQSPIAVSGIWKLKGAQVCRTLAPVQPEEVCETWLRSGAKEVIIQVNGKEVSRNRWQ